jgi:peptidoglycan/LPS O-acetylase OafA/YrhL
VRRIELLDYARFAAAWAVVAFHFLFKGIQEGKTPSLEFIPGVSEIAKYGYLGVQLFFMISGYVIFFSAKGKTAGAFAASRALRLYPAFWVAVLFTSAVSFLFGGDTFRVSGAQVLANLTMVPGPLGYDLVDGVYWTLAYELKFYLLVGAMLFLGLACFLDAFFIGWPLLMVVALALGKSDITYLGGVYAFFAAGALFAMLHEKRTFWRLGSLGLCLFLCVQTTLQEGARMTSDQGIPYAPAVLVTLIILLFAFFAALQIPRLFAMKLPYSRLAGGLTYPLYLTHSVLGIILLSRFATRSNAPIAYLAVVVAILVVAYALHAIVERRMADRWRRFFYRVVRQPVDSLRGLLMRRVGVARTA